LRGILYLVKFFIFACSLFRCFFLPCGKSTVWSAVFAVTRDVTWSSAEAWTMPSTSTIDLNQRQVGRTPCLGKQNTRSEVRRAVKTTPQLHCFVLAQVHNHCSPTWRRLHSSHSTQPPCWRFGVCGSALVFINEVNLRRARLALGWVTVSGFDSRGRHFISVCNQSPRSTQPSTLRGTVKWVPAKRRWYSAAGE